MPRPPRIDLDGAIHHVMNRGVARQRTFFADADRVEFGARLTAIHEQFGVETLAYCLMDNHFHLLLRTPRGDLPAAMHHLGLVYTRHTNDRVGRDGPLFRGRYRSIMVTTDRYLVCAARYIHRNALDVSGVDHPDAYRWSSYRAYLGRRPAAPFLNTAVVLEQFGHDRARFARFTESDDATPEVGPVVGVADLDQMIELAVARDDLAHGDDHTQRWTARTALLLLAERLEPGPLREAVDASLSFPTLKARENALRRASLRLADPAVGRVVSAVLDDVARHDRAA